MAKAFKILGILEDDETASSSFYPSHFSMRYQTGLKLTKGTTLDTELMVIMDRGYLENPTEQDALPNE